MLLRPPSRPASAPMELTVENTAIVLDSTADYPEGPDQIGRAHV